MQPTIDRQTTATPPAGVDLEVVEAFLARVLCREHDAALAVDATSEARMILRLAHSFADELDAVKPGFDRVAFIHAATTDPA